MDKKNRLPFWMGNGLHDPFDLVIIYAATTAKLFV
jgi:hypothetical protein